MTDRWAGYDQAELERQYSPSTRAPDADRVIRSYTTASEAATAALEHRMVRYGEHADEWSILFPVGPEAPLLVFVHGGYWQMLSAHDSTYMAPGLVERGVAFAAVNYSLAPGTTLDAIVGQCRRAVASLASRATAAGAYDPDRIHLSGHSAGAQLVAMVVAGGHPSGVRSATLLSGVFDLQPLLATSVNQALGLDAEAARRNSPVLFPPPAGVRILVVVGEHDTEEFHRQSGELAARWGTDGGGVVVVPGRHHFDLLFDMSDLSTTVGRLLQDRFI